METWKKIDSLKCRVLNVVVNVVALDQFDHENFVCFG